jgi:hypothetical protein
LSYCGTICDCFLTELEGNKSVSNKYGTDKRGIVMTDKTKMDSIGKEARHVSREQNLQHGGIG